MNIPYKIIDLIGDRTYKIDTIGKSNSEVICFDDMVLKIEKQCEESDNEHQMMAWLADKLPVPKILCSEKNETKNYLLMSKINGRMSCDSDLLKNPKLLVRALAEGLRMLWSVNIDNCPCNNSLEHKLKLAEENIRNNLCDVDDSEPETYGENGFANPEELLQWLRDNKPKEELVFSHGDFCLPNIFIKDNKVSGFIDLGRSGISDIYQDIALCYRSLSHNCEGAYGGRVYKDFDAKILFDELGIEPNWEKIKYYILLDELF